MPKLNYAIAIFAAVLVSTGARAQSLNSDLASPDGRLVLHFQTLADDEPADVGQLSYSVTFNKTPVINSSALQLDLTGMPPLGAAVKITGVTASSNDWTYHLLAGKASLVRDHYNALTLNLEEPAAPHRKLAIEARVYDDAIAFRYVVPEQAALKSFQLAAEHTLFNIAKDGTAYGLLLPHFKSMYESEYVPLPISALTNQGGVPSSLLLGCPCLIEIPGVAWINIEEADLRGYSSMYLTNPSGAWTGHYLESKLSPHPDDSTIAVQGSLPHHSAWRVIQVADDPGRLIESNILTSLNPETQLRDTSWIHPGKASWNWWNGSIGPDGKSAYTTEVMKYYVDFAASAGLEYMLIDAGWSNPHDITQMNGKVDIPAIVEYAKSKNVKIWIWLGYRETARQMVDAFPLYEKWGVAGLKIDFIERNDQAGMEWYYKTAQLAADHHLMLDFHGSTTPSGLERTFPNVLGYEAVLGMEQSKAGMRDNPTHQLTLPFTRMLAGPMDYTPGSFHNTTREQFEPVMDRPMTIGTRAHQLAMYAVYWAPIQMVSDNPDAYANASEFDFIKQCPSTWDETHVICGRPAEFIAIARRHDHNWYVGAMTNDTPRHLDIPLAFLPAGHFSATIYADASDAGGYPTHVSVVRRSVSNTESLSADLASAGGYAVRITP